MVEENQIRETFRPQSAHATWLRLRLLLIAELTLLDYLAKEFKDPLRQVDVRGSPFELKSGHVMVFQMKVPERFLIAQVLDDF